MSASTRRDVVRIGLGAFALSALAPLAAGCASAGSSGPLRVGLLPILEALPLWVAAEDGLFARRGVKVELLLFASAFERDAALQAGQLDVVLNDMISAALLNKDAPRVKIVRTAYVTNKSLPMVSIVGAPGLQVTSAQDLRGKSVAISSNTVIEYVVDRLLERSGIRPDEIRKTEVTKLPVRVEMVTKGQVDAAAIPEPLATLAIAQGARRIVDDGEAGIGQSVLTARIDSAESRGEDLRSLLAAFSDGIAALKANPSGYRALFVDKAKVPDALRDSLPFPDFPGNVVPPIDRIADALAWAVAKGLVPATVRADTLADPRYLK